MGMIVSWMLVAAAIGAFAVTALSGCFVIPALHKLHFGQTIRESGPTWHNKKQGTPTMGGLCFIFGILVACGLVYAGFYRYAQDLLGIVQVRAALLALFLAFGSGFIGFLDDYIKVVKHRNLGLLAWQKLIMQFVVTGGFLVGLVMMYLISNINYRSLRHMNWYLYILTLLLLVWALFSEPYNGCYRWVYMFGTTLQPSELAKFSAILGLACFADRYYEKRGTLLYGIVLPVLPLLPVVVLLYKEPHNSAIMLILLIAGSMILCGGVGRFWCIPAAGAAVFVIYKMLTGQNNYVQQRLGAWNGDEGDILYQTQQSLYSIASGGLTGLGIGNSRQKHLWLPEASNDFIFSVLCEELGFIGAVICMGLFAALIIQGVIIALNSPDYFGTMLGIGIMSQIAWQAMIHIAVVTNVAPNTGISLPFFSSGGTSLLILLCEMGIILSISRAGNAQNAARSKRSHEELARRMNPQRRTHKALHSN